MDLKNKIKELRAIIPVPMSEAMVLLKENNCDIQKCAEIFKEQSIDYIVSQTNCTREEAKANYVKEKYDINRTISIIKENLFDASYKPIEGVTREKLLKVREWFNLSKSEDFATAMQYKNIDSVIETLLQIPSLAEIGNIIKESYAAYSKIFEGYSDNDPISEFVIRNKKLDDDTLFNTNRMAYNMKTIKLNEELTRHIRNSK